MAFTFTPATWDRERKTPLECVLPVDTISETAIADTMAQLAAAAEARIHFAQFVIQKALAMHICSQSLGESL